MQSGLRMEGRDSHRTRTWPALARAGDRHKCWVHVAVKLQNWGQGAADGRAEQATAIFLTVVTEA